MSNFLTLGPNPVLSLIPNHSRSLNPYIQRTHRFNLNQNKPFGRGTVAVPKSGLNQVPFPSPDEAEVLIKDLFGRLEGLFYTLADVAVSGSADPAMGAKQGSDWLSGITYYMETVLKVLKDGLSTLHVPYSYGFAIITLTVLVKAATFPLTRKQVESAMAMRSLQPQIKAIQKRYAGDQEKLQLETARLYKLAGINPLAGCLPTLATIPVWIGLYRALSNVADEGLLTEGFFWIPSLAGPTTVAARQSGSGISWLFPFIDGQPPLGWPQTFAYLVLPVLLVVSQYVSVQIMQSTQANDPNMKSSQIITKFLPLMIGYFALSVPSGLSLYWLTNNVLSTAQQVWLQKLGGAKNPVSKLSGNLIQEEPSEIKKPIVDSITTPKEPTMEKQKIASSGPSPGDRFKQLKKQEARKRQQREEEKRRADEVAANATQTTEGCTKEGTSNVDESKSVDESTSSKNGSANGNLYTSNHNGVNGNLSTTGSKEDKNTPGLDSNENNLLERKKEAAAVAATDLKDIKDASSD